MQTDTTPTEIKEMSIEELSNYIEKLREELDPEDSEELIDILSST